MLLMEQTKQMQLQKNNLMRSTLKQLQRILIWIINTLLRIQKREQVQN